MHKFFLALILIAVFMLIMYPSIFFGINKPSHLTQTAEPVKTTELFDSIQTEESFDSLQTSNGILIFNNGELSSFKTNTNSLLLIDESGLLKNLGLPIGMVIPFAGTGVIPNGWAECDGTLGTPDLKNRFILGNNSTRAVGATGDEDQVTLTSENIPKHTHGFNAFTVTREIADGGCGDNKHRIGGYTSQPTTSTGGGEAHDNMPPFYVLRYICYTGVQNTGTPTGTNIVILDNNGNSKFHKTTNNSLLITDSSGNLNKLSFLAGMIMMWNDSENIPSGWAMCDGSLINGFRTPDLKSRFIFGKSSRTLIDATGGYEKVQLTTEQIPAHTHNLVQNNIGPNCFYTSTNCSATRGEHVVFNSRNSVSTSSDGTGGGEAHNNMPPYYVLCYICYVGIVGDPGTPSKNEIMLTNNFGELSKYVTKNDSLLLTDSTGVLKSLSFKKGIITAWYNIGITGLPPGWSLCDGNKYPAIDGYQTPDLRGKFILGYDKDKEPVGPSDKGEEQVTLELKHVPSHSHNIYYPDYGNSCFAYGSSFLAQIWERKISDGGNLSKADGTVAPHNNMPPYFVLCYICYTGDKL